MDKGKRDKVKVGVKTINQLLERRKEMKSYSSILMVLLFILAFGLTQGCSKGSSPTEPSSGGTVADTGSGSGSGSSSGSDSGSGSGNPPPSTPPPSTPTFAVTDATVVAGPPSYTSSCTTAKTFLFSGTITVNGPGTVSYRWETSIGTSIQEEYATFNAAGSRPVFKTLQLAESYAGWARIRILTPNGMVSNQASFSLVCFPTEIII